METVKAAIRRDGLALARVPPAFELELTKYGGSKPLEMLKFRLVCLPRDTSSWKFNEACILSVVHRLESRLRLAREVSDGLEIYSPMGDVDVVQGSQSLAMSRFYVTETNLFHDLLLTLLRRFYICWAEVMVLTLNA
jgi:hypothetical protein